MYTNDLPVVYRVIVNETTVLHSFSPNQREELVLIFRNLKDRFFWVFWKVWTYNPCNTKESFR